MYIPTKYKYGKKNIFCIELYRINDIVFHYHIKQYQI